MVDPRIYYCILTPAALACLQRLLRQKHDDHEPVSSFVACNFNSHSNFNTCPSTEDGYMLANGRAITTRSSKEFNYTKVVDPGISQLTLRFL